MARRQSGYDCEFVEKPPKPFQFECPVCLLILRKPYQATCCGYSFCRACIEQIMTHTHMQCPCCKKANFQVYSNKGLRRSLSELQVHCSNQKKGCEWVGELGEIDDHLNCVDSTPSLERQTRGCRYVDVECIYCFNLMQRLDIQVHVKERCQKRPYSCQYCGRYDSNFEDVSTNHLPVCPFYPIDCPNKCGKVLQRQHTEKHVSDECPLTVVDCVFKDIGCSVRLPEKDMPAHVADSVSAHLLPQTTACNQMMARLENENKKLKKDNKLLHQKLEKQQQQITKLTEDLQALHIVTPLAPVEFTMLEFDAYRRGGTSWFSPPFYAHFEGYKMYLEIDANGYNEGEGTYVSVYISLMRGEFDDQLQWPFRGNVTIHFLNQMPGAGDEPDYTDVLPFDDDTPWRYTSRVEGDEYPDDVYGFDMFCSHADLVPAYLRDDCLKIRIEVDTGTY